MHSAPLLRWTSAGLYCQAGDFYIDPVRPVRRAIITHAHSDHARLGMHLYIAHTDTVPLLHLRLGAGIATVGLLYGEKRSINGVNISLHPAGHIIGSAQVRISYQGEVWVVSGDYHTVAGTYCTPYEPVRCHTFITESTFGQPLFAWPQDSQLYGEMNQWIEKNRSNGDASILISYALGKAQRLLNGLAARDEQIYVHSSIQTIQECLRHYHPIAETIGITSQTSRHLLAGKIIIAPPGILKGNWLKSLPPHRTAYLSGWAQDAERRMKWSTDSAFPLSDHADFEGLLYAVRATAASRVLTYHGYDALFSRHLGTLGIESYPLHPHHAPTLF